MRIIGAVLEAATTVLPIEKLIIIIISFTKVLNMCQECTQLSVDIISF